MRMMFPGIRERRSIDRHLRSFFHAYSASSFRRAIARISRFYYLPTPRIEWFEYLDWGKTAGRTLENGKIFLVHPENWKRGRKYNSERQWIQTVYHEMGHYVLWADAERKADAFAYRFVRGVPANGRACENGRANGAVSATRRRAAGAMRSRPRPHRRRSRSH